MNTPHLCLPFLFCSPSPHLPLLQVLARPRERRPVLSSAGTAESADVARSRQWWARGPAPEQRRARARARGRGRQRRHRPGGVGGRGGARVQRVQRALRGHRRAARAGQRDGAQRQQRHRRQLLVFPPRRRRGRDVRCWGPRDGLPCTPPPPCGTAEPAYTTTCLRLALHGVGPVGQAARHLPPRPKAGREPALLDAFVALGRRGTGCRGVDIACDCNVCTPGSRVRFLLTDGCGRGPVVLCWAPGRARATPSAAQRCTTWGAAG